MTAENDTIDIKASWSAMVSAANVGGRKARGATVAERRSAEKDQVSKKDGRRLRRTGRDTQMNLKVRPEVRAEFLALAEARGVSMGELLEVVLGEWKVTRGKT